MEGEKIFMSQRQLQRFEVMGLVEAGKITLMKGSPIKRPLSRGKTYPLQEKDIFLIP